MSFKSVSSFRDVIGDPLRQDNQEIKFLIARQREKGESYYEPSQIPVEQS